MTSGPPPSEPAVLSWQVEFDFINPEEEDFHGMKLFLQNMLDDEPFDDSGLADLALAQVFISRNAFINQFWRVSSPAKSSTYCSLLLIEI